jgi:hypothetical protein
VSVSRHDPVQRSMGYVSFVLLIEALSVLDSGQGPFVNVKLEILKYSNSLASLPLREVQEGLAFAGIRVLPVDPCRNLLGQELDDSKRTACSLSIASFSALMVEVRVVHIVALTALALPIMF